MDATQKARVAEINTALQKRGADMVTGSARHTLVDELATLLTGPEPAATSLAPEQQARADKITDRLRDHVVGKPDAHLDVFERRRLVEELATLTGADGEAAVAAGGEAA